MIAVVLGFVCLLWVAYVAFWFPQIYYWYKYSQTRKEEIYLPPLPASYRPLREFIYIMPNGTWVRAWRMQEKFL